MKRLRRHTLLVSLMLAGFFTVGSRGGAAAEGARPNIVILYADDMGYGDLAVQNPDSKIPTPHLDRLAREGMRFTDAHSSCGVCTPSRYALLEGRYHWRKFHGMVNAFEPSTPTSRRSPNCCAPRATGRPPSANGISAGIGRRSGGRRCRRGRGAARARSTLRRHSIGRGQFPTDRWRMDSIPILVTMCPTSLPTPGSRTIGCRSLLLSIGLRRESRQRATGNVGRGRRWRAGIAPL